METESHLPYGFASYPDRTPRKRSPRGHDGFAGNSGLIECELEALSPILVMDTDNRAGSSRSEIGRFMQNKHETYVIPGTSLKGMVRSLFEVLVPSCVGLHDSSTNRLVPGPFESCGHRTNLCPACRTFGFMGRGQGSTVHRGRVNIGQAEAVGSPSQHREVQIVGQFNPQPTESDRYWTSSRDPKGRKFYYHQHELCEATTQNEKDWGKWLAPLKPGATFEFTVSFENLEDEALDGLVAALDLPDQAPLREGGTTKVRPKLGYGKAAGLGSVDVRINEVRLDPDPETRYRDFGATRTQPDDLEAWVGERRAPFFENPDPPVQDLIEVLRYPPPEDRTYQYPNDWE